MQIEAKFDCTLHILEVFDSGYVSYIKNVLCAGSRVADSRVSPTRVFCV